MNNQYFNNHGKAESQRKTGRRHRMTLEETAKDRELLSDVMETSLAGHIWRTKTWPDLIFAMHA